MAIPAALVPPVAGARLPPLQFGMTEPLVIYIFRDPHFAPDGDTMVCVVERTGCERFLSKNEISSAFSGHVAFRRWWPWQTFIGVYGRRNASRFRRFLRERGADLTILREMPSRALLVYWRTEGERKRIRTRPPRVA